MNIFEVLSANYEVFHSRMLAWLLNPGESHGGGDRFLKPLLQQLDLSAENVQVDTEVQVRVPHAARWRLADVVIRTERHFVLIENKVDPLYQDAQQVAEEIAGGRALAESEKKQFCFVFLAPGPLAQALEEAIDNQGHFISWQSLVDDLTQVEFSGLEPTCEAIIKQYFDFCRSQFIKKSPSHSGKPSGDDAVLAQSIEALRAEVEAIPKGELLTAVEIWSQFCDQYPDHVSRLESRWAESSHYSAKSWLARRLHLWATNRDLIEDTGEWRTVDSSWGFPKVRVYRRLDSD